MGRSFGVEMMSTSRNPPSIKVASSCLHTILVSGKRRVPTPPARRMAFFIFDFRSIRLAPLAQDKLSIFDRCRSNAKVIPPIPARIGDKYAILQHHFAYKLTEITLEMPRNRGTVVPNLSSSMFSPHAFCKHAFSDQAILCYLSSQLRRKHDLSHRPVHRGGHSRQERNLECHRRGSIR